jgi:hypothetical protein
MVAEATVDCYSDDEQVMGLFTMIDDNLALPFQTAVLGVAVSVVSVDLSDSGQIVATCSRDELRQAIPILDLPDAGVFASGCGVDRGVSPMGRLRVNRGRRGVNMRTKAVRRRHAS